MYALAQPLRESAGGKRLPYRQRAAAWCVPRVGVEYRAYPLYSRATAGTRTLAPANPAGVVPELVFLPRRKGARNSRLLSPAITQRRSPFASAFLRYVYIARTAPDRIPGRVGFLAQPAKVCASRQSLALPCTALCCAAQGCFVFCADLLRHVTFPYELDFMALSSYDKGNAAISLSVASEYQ